MGFDHAFVRRLGLQERQVLLIEVRADLRLCLCLFVVVVVFVLV